MTTNHGTGPDAAPAQMPDGLRELITGPEWLHGTFGDAYREIGAFRIYVFPGVDITGDTGWEIVVSHRRNGGSRPNVEIAELHATSDVVRALEQALAQSGGAGEGAAG